MRFGGSSQLLQGGSMEAERGKRQATHTHTHTFHASAGDPARMGGRVGGGRVTDPKPTKNPTQHGTAAMALLVVDEERPGALPMSPNNASGSITIFTGLIVGPILGSIPWGFGSKMGHKGPRLWRCFFRAHL